ncbi:NUDIX hydrolase [Leptothrix discophora]|uniref:CoA pyrophosphatase n=1 Tax=Leptothrix discophora TaxID=89 RepID=A0ABT9G391_LEPDI|nr:CoA pyrophosphatase [Leptothrix discophora]MDP4300954.1 CoA pyrophosphatase [Leptothrix discophora]
MSSPPSGLIRDPRGIPIIGTDAHLPPVPADRLTIPALRQRLASPPAWTPAYAGDAARLGTTREPSHAAVLVPLVDRPDGLHVLLTRRTDHLKDHAGQISFPGGRTEPGEHDAAITALREAEEEVGLRAEHVELIGRMPVYRTVTSFIVTPVVALVHPPFELRIDPQEVAEAFEVPLAFLMTPAHHRRHRHEADGISRQFLSMPWLRTDPLDPQAPPREYFIWGATAAMLRNFYHLLSA